MLALSFAGAQAFTATAGRPSLFTHASAAPAVNVNMKWGELIGDQTAMYGPDGRPSQLTRDHGKLVITLASTGNINTRERNPTLPCSPKEMADQMHECIKHGVSVLHIHARVAGTTRRARAL